MNCHLCQSPMSLATESRGYKTYRCRKGCNYYQYIEMTAPIVNVNSISQPANTAKAQQDSAQIAATV